MRRICVVLIGLMAALACRGQNDSYRVYYENVNLAEKMMLQNRWLAADSCYRLAFGACPKQGYNLDYLNAAFNAARQHDTVAVDRYLVGFATRGGNYRMLAHSFSQNRFLEENAVAMLQYIEAERHNNLRQTLNKAYKHYAVTVNPALIKKINGMYANDQRVARGFFTGLLPSRTQARIMNKADSRHGRKLLAICQVYGWPGFDLLGEYREYGKYRLEKIDVLLRHVSQKDLELLTPYIIRSIKGLNYYPSILAGCLDYNDIKNPVYNSKKGVYELKQRYGSLSQTENGVSTLMPFGTAAELARNRRELFLGDIEDYCNIRGISRMPSVECLIIEAKPAK